MKIRPTPFSAKPAPCMLLPNCGHCCSFWSLPGKASLTGRAKAGQPPGVVELLEPSPSGRPDTAALLRLPQGPPGDLGFKGIQGPRGPPGLMVSPLPVCPRMVSHPRPASHQLGDVTLPDRSVLSPLCPLSPLLFLNIYFF